MYEKQLPKITPTPSLDKVQRTSDLSNGGYFAARSIFSLLRARDPRRNNRLVGRVRLQARKAIEKDSLGTFMDGVARFYAERQSTPLDPRATLTQIKRIRARLDKARRVWTLIHAHVAAEAASQNLVLAQDYGQWYCTEI